MSARNYVESLKITHRGERAEWREPQWTAHWSLLLAMLNTIDELTRRLEALEGKK